MRGELAYRLKKGPSLTDKQLNELVSNYDAKKSDLSRLPLQIYKMNHDGQLEKSIILPFKNEKGDLGPFIEFHIYGFLFQLLLNPVENDPISVTYLKDDGSIYICSIPYSNVGTV